MVTSGQRSTSAPRRSSSPLNTSSSRISGTAIRLPLRFQSIIGAGQYHPLRPKCEQVFRGENPALVCIRRCTPPPCFGARGAEQRPAREVSPGKNAGTRIAFDKLDDDNGSEREECRCTCAP